MKVVSAVKVVSVVKVVSAVKVVTAVVVVMAVGVVKAVMAVKVKTEVKTAPTWISLVMNPRPPLVGPRGCPCRRYRCRLLLVAKWSGGRYLASWQGRQHAY